MNLISIRDTDCLYDPDTLEILSPEGLSAREARDDLDSGPCKRRRPGTTKSFSIQLLVTTACNIRCRYCFAARQAGQSMDSPTVSDCVSFVRRLLADYDQVIINFFGGEPLVNRPAIEQFVRELNEPERVAYALTTNGTLLDQDVIKLLADLKADVCISLDGPKHIHDSRRVTAGGGGTFDAAFDALRRVQDAGLSCSVECVVDIDDPHAVEQFQFLTPLGLGRVQMSLNLHYDYPLTAARSQALIDQIRTVASLYVRDLKTRQKDCYSFALGPCFGSDALLLIHNLIKRNGRCRDEACAIAPDGGMYRCGALVGNESFGRGTVTEPLEPAPVAGGEACLTCWARHICGGVCHYQRVQHEKEGSFLDPGLCDIHRAACEEALRTYLDIRHNAWEVLFYFERCGA